PFSLLPSHSSLLTPPCSLLPAHSSLLTPPCSRLVTPCPWGPGRIVSAAEGPVAESAPAFSPPSIPEPAAPRRP
ncbi:MAG TPA: hypothetical protein EYP56_21395, partial [Planctomycetaceae bacterium]|nr:hypothetical protein [Planctomycetaceae bacterium]